MDAADEAAALDEDGRARTSLDDLAARGTLTGRADGGGWTIVHRCVVGRLRFEGTHTEIRLGISKNPVVGPDGAIVLETAFPRDQIVLPPVARPQRLEDVRGALITAVTLSKAPRSQDAVRLLEAAAALVLGQAGHLQGILRTAPGRQGWSVETPDGIRHPLARDVPPRPGPPQHTPSPAPGQSDLSLPAAVLQRIPWCGIDRRPADGWTVETTAHARLAAADVVRRLAPLYGLDPAPWTS